MLDQLHSCGLSVSYHRIKNLATDIANTVIAKWKSEDIVIPPNAVKGVVTCLGLDNIDWNARNPLAQELSTLHGTIFIIHQFVESKNPYSLIEIAEEEQGKKIVQELPESYTNINYDFTIQASDPYTIPKINQDPVKLTNLGLDGPLLEDTLLEPQKQWLSDCKVSVLKKDLHQEEYVTWGAYHASKTEAPTLPPIQSFPNPLFIEKASEPSMVAHIMILGQAVTEKLNSGQTPWLETDQPLYHLAKRIQQKYPDEFGENKMLITMGALHIEKMLWAASGEFVNGSGYTSAIASSGICCTGVAESITSVSNILRTRYVKQVSVVAIEILKQRAYLKYTSNKDKLITDNEQVAKRPTEAQTDTECYTTETERTQTVFEEEPTESVVETSTESNTPKILSYDEWLAKQCKEQPQSDFWNKAQKLDLLILQFVKTIRDGDFLCYRTILDTLMKWIMALDRSNYERSLPLMLRDLSLLEERHPGLYVEFVQNKRFVGHKTQHAFSRLPVDQCTEQVIDWLKNDSGVIGNLDDPSTIRQDQVARPELARMLQLFEDTDRVQDKKKHHEQYSAKQNRFKEHVLSLVDTFEHMAGNMFSEESGHLYDLLDKIIMPEEVVEDVRNIEEKGLLKYRTELNKKILEKTCPVSDPIPKTSMKLFKYGLNKRYITCTPKSQISCAKNQLQQIVDIVTAYQCSRPVNAYTLSHENSELPPTLTKKGTMYHGTKSDLLNCIIPPEEAVQDRHGEYQPDVEVPHTCSDAACTIAILDGAVVAQFLRPPSDVPNFESYIKKCFMPYIASYYKRGYRRVDLVNDNWKQGSLKEEVRRFRGKGKIVKVDLKTKIPGDWAAFLRVDSNKNGLFKLISEYLTENMIVPEGSVFITTFGNEAICKPCHLDISEITPCSHEEADVRIFLHLGHAVSEGHKDVFIRTNDTDVVVLATAAAAQLDDVIGDIIIGFGVGNRKKTKK